MNDGARDGKLKGLPATVQSVALLVECNGCFIRCKTLATGCVPPHLQNTLNVAVKTANKRKQRSKYSPREDFL
jgi:hypothetical protein